MDERDGKTMRGPSWKWEFSPNSIGLILGFLAMFASIVTGWANLSNKLENHSDRIADNRAAIVRIDRETRRLDLLEQRQSATEQQASSEAESLSDMRETVIQLRSDIRFVREILERMERHRNGGRQYPGRK